MHHGQVSKACIISIQVIRQMLILGLAQISVAGDNKMWCSLRGSTSPYALVSRGYCGKKREVATEGMCTVSGWYSTNLSMLP